MSSYSSEGASTRRLFLEKNCCAYPCLEAGELWTRFRHLEITAF